jgi:hypothetical protein
VLPVRRIKDDGPEIVIHPGPDGWELGLEADRLVRVNNTYVRKRWMKGKTNIEVAG